MTAPLDPNEVLFGNTTPSFQFENFGDTCQGIITEMSVQRQTDKNSGEPKSWPSGDPMWMMVLTVQTQERDPSIPEDDGKRRLFIRGRSLTDATKAAVAAAGKREVQRGALITVSYIGNGPVERRGNTPPKLYSVGYQILGAVQPVVPQSQPLSGTYAQTPQQAVQQAAVVPQVNQQPPAKAADMIDVSSLPEEAQALIRQMQGQQ